MTFGAFLATTFSLFMPFWLSEFIWGVLADAILLEEQAKFLKDKYLPELGKHISDVEITFDE
jgi:hypothetical protein